MYTMILVGVVLVSMAGCGKTLSQIQQVAHDLVDVGGKVYEDSKDNVETVKGVVTPEPTK